MPLDVVSRRFPEKCEGDQHALRHLLLLRRFGLIMKQPDDTLRVRPGSIGDGGRGAARPKSFVGQVMRAARKAGHTGTGFGRDEIPVLVSPEVVPQRLPCRFARHRAAW
jgi:hypothetical protein